MPADADRPLAIDTSLAIPLLHRRHEAHEWCSEWRQDRELVLCGHAWLETYSVLTRLPGHSRLAGGDAAELMDAELGPPLQISESVFGRAPRLLSEAGITGGAAYDGLIALTAIDHDTTLASRDGRAELTYRRLGAAVEMVP